jgi:hypothetical protein
VHRHDGADVRVGVLDAAIVGVLGEDAVTANGADALLAERRVWPDEDCLLVVAEDRWRHGVEVERHVGDDGVGEHDHERHAEPVEMAQLPVGGLAHLRRTGPQSSSGATGMAVPGAASS